ncbi:porin [Massilia sp. TS11]|uniref:porin n=1 Tax=Massilia sp. TS11 TaxID=2908003 RepID=UPI001EDAA4CA|nr:porin [Massilia sp. TS11]MCG2585960.1 porin [Massilia sp. TS11]
MKKALLTTLLLAAAGAAQAESNVVIYGTIDAGFAKSTDKTLAVAKRDANRLGFRGTEDLGDNLKALFQLEMRFEPDTGTAENGNRPLFQGQSRVGLQGDFGTVRIGRALTAYMEAKDAFDPWNGVPSTAGFKGDLLVAGYNAAPLDPAGSGTDRTANGFWYNSPSVNGFAVATSIGTKESNGGAAIIGRGTAAAPQFAAGANGSTNPFSLAASYKNSSLAVMLGYDRNAIETKLISFNISTQATTELKLTAAYAKQDQDATKPVNSVTKAWVIGANYVLGNGKLLAGYGQKNPEGVAKTKQSSIGYQYSLSKRTYTYVEASNKTTTTGVRFHGAGINHSF